MIVNGKEYPFDSPTHRMIGADRVDLKDQEIEEIVKEWAVEYDKQQAKIDSSEDALEYLNNL
jgi:hypothetical protein